jgi:hypothetical protein
MYKSNTFVFHCDPGHGWLEVSKEDLQYVGLSPSDFSSYSYRKGNRFFLEEDCDAGLFLNAYEKESGLSPDFKYVNTDRQHWIRDLPYIKEAA